MKQKLLAECFGTALLLMIVTGSGISGERLAMGNTAVALLANSIATGAGLYVLITVLSPISGAHFNPVVTLFCHARKALTWHEAGAYIVAQTSGAVIGVWLTHMIYALPLLQISQKPRSGIAQWASEFIATLLLVGTIHLAQKHAREKTPLVVALLVTAGYWFTSSTFFANPAVSIARMLTDTFVGIRPADVPGFICAQFAALTLLLAVVRRHSQQP
ncbi:MAG TPA: MIP/aquaporin family protein [Rhodocyclaceae bacterium]|nr:MIP/aquaporin family protein [Rhodocyclaceae bacterium]